MARKDDDKGVEKTTGPKRPVKGRATRKTDDTATTKAEAKAPAAKKTRATSGKSAAPKAPSATAGSDGAASGKATASGSGAKDAPAAKPKTKRSAATRATQPARTRAADRHDTRTGVRKIASPRKPGAGADEPVPQDAPSAATTTNTPAPAPAPEPAEMMPLPARIAENIERIEDLGQRLVQALARRPIRPPSVEAPGPELYAAATTGWMKMAAEQPARMIENQVRYWGETLRHLSETQSTLLRKGFVAPEPDADAAPDRDKRFANPVWRSSPVFHYIREQYRINADAMRKAAADLPIEDEVHRRRIDWFTRQIIDMMAPTNFLATNPDALEKAIETEGESLVRGLENLVADLEGSGGELVVSLCDPNAFRVGENIGTSPGAVVHRTPLFEMIQYTPTTEKVHATPLVIFPPWINKFYILDLKPQNSMIRWLVDQGHTLFVVSWKNPDGNTVNTGLDDYVSAYLDVIGKVLELTDQPQVNAVGYCIGGTTLAMTLALMARRGDERVKSATFFTTLTDFSDQGEFTTYLQDDFVGGIEEEVARTGYLSSRLMQRTFSFLRANDLVWGPAVRNYMMGEAPPAFDLLYWNGDGTNLPARMVTEYLRGLCQQNRFAGAGYDLLGETVRLSDIRLPVCAIACENDHIAPWHDSWRGIAMMASDDKTFLLSESGHIAGIVNPPTRKKYGHYTSDAGFGGDADSWKAGAQYQPGSWWPDWQKWLAGMSGDMVAAREPQDAIEPAPGSYVLEKA